MRKITVLGAKEDEKFLSRLVTSVGKFHVARDQPHINLTYGEWSDCKVTEMQLADLDDHWGRFVWTTESTITRVEDDPHVRLGDERKIDES